MARFMTFVLAGAISLSLIACNQAPKAEVERESERLDAMTEDLRSEAERAANDLGIRATAGTGMTREQSQVKADALEAQAGAVRNRE